VGTDPDVITVLVAAVSGRARAALAARLDRHKTLHTLVASPDLTLVEQLDAVRPDVLLLEGSEGSPAAVLGALDLLPHPPAVVLVTDEARDTLEAGRLRAGVAAVLPRHATADELVAAVEAAAAGLLVLHRDVARDLRWPPAAAARAAATGGDQTLTPREVEVLGMLAEGLANKSIAARLGISDHTVKFHVAAILDKLDADSRTEAVTIGIRRGLILV
jgi:DNA-binding NarL/FixJ family response regulator